MDIDENEVQNKKAIIDEKEVHKLIDRFQETPPSSFEDAIKATGYGTYNYLLLFCVIFPCATQMTETISISYILPIAECDLDLSLEDKGILNGVTFAGMIGSGLFWGYMIDALGRKQIIVYGYFVTGALSIISACSTNKYVLILMKFCVGLTLNGPFSATTSHITEFHSSKYRQHINMIRGLILSVVNLLVPLLAWAILPRSVNISVLGLFDLKSWNVFLLIVAFHPIISGCLYIFLPESPKFLMTIGRNREALAVLRQVYAKNTGESKESFPITCLAEETTQNLGSTKDLSLALKNGYSEMKTIFHRPHNKYLAIACFNAFCLTMSLNTLKLWLPGIFQSINDYEKSHNDTSSSMCVMLAYMGKPKDVSSAQTCTVNMDNLSVYVNTFIVASARIAAFTVADTFVKCMGVKKLNHYRRSKARTPCIQKSFQTVNYLAASMYVFQVMRVILCLISAVLMFCIYFARNSLTVTILSAAGSGIGSVPENILVTVTLELFPTTLRTIALSMHLMCARLGALIGNIIFPFLVHLGCLPPFLFILISASACGLLSFRYGSIDNKPLI